MRIDADKVFVTYYDSHWVLVYADTEADARKMNGRIIGHYLDADKAVEARDTLKTVQRLGYESHLRETSCPGSPNVTPPLHAWVACYNEKKKHPVTGVSAEDHQCAYCGAYKSDSGV